MTTIGIDIGGRTHVVARCRDGQARADREILRVSQSRAGFAVLDAWLDAAARAGDARDDGVVGPLLDAARLRTCAGATIPVAVVNPLAAKYFAKSRLARTKSDPADARSLAEMAMRDTPAARDPLAGVELRQAARFAMTLVDRAGEGLPAPHPPRRARLPGARRAVRRSDLPDRPRGAAHRAHRARPRPADGRRPWPTPTPARVIGGWARRRPSGSRPPRPTRSRCPSSTPRSPSRSACCSTSTTCSSARSSDADRRVAGLLDGETARRLQTIPGVGPSIAATLLAEIGDIERFDDFDQLLAYAGVHPAERSSGRKGSNPETSWHMSKAGNSHLRAAAYRMAVVGVQHNPVIAAHYARKRAAGKSKMNALGHCMRKALSIVWGVWRNGPTSTPTGGSKLDKTLWDLGLAPSASRMARV